MVWTQSQIFTAGTNIKLNNLSVKRKSWKETAPPDLFIIYDYTSVVLTVELPDCMTHLYTCGGNSELIQGQHVISVLWLLLIDLQLACYVVSFIVSDNDLIVKFLFQAFHGIDFYTFEMMPLHFYLICRRVSSKHVCLVPVSLWTPKPSFCPFTNSETQVLSRWLSYYTASYLGGVCETATSQS